MNWLLKRSLFSPVLLFFLFCPIHCSVYFRRNNQPFIFSPLFPCNFFLSGGNAAEVLNYGGKQVLCADLEGAPTCASCKVIVGWLRCVQFHLFVAFR